MNQADRKRVKTQKRFSVILYILSFLWLFVPWITVGEKKYGIPQLALLLRRDGMESIAGQIEGFSEDIQTLNVGVRIALGIYLAWFVVCAAYLVTVLAEKNWNLNLASIFLSVALCYTGIGTDMIGGLVPFSIFPVMYPFGFLFLCVAECIGRKFIELWDDTKEKIAIDQELDRQIKEERKRRLSYPGKYTRLFFRIIWKNFRKGLKDYLALLICNGLVFFCVLAGLLLHQSFGFGGIVDAGYPVGAGKILFQSIVGLIVAGVFMLVLLLLYYIRKRMPEYGVFQTLGARRKTLYLCMGLELGLGVAVSLAVGAVPACMGLGLHPLTVLKAVGVMLLLYLVTFFVTHDLFVGMNMGSRTDLTMLKEKMPGKYHGIFVLLGCLACAGACLRYRKTENFEGIWNLVLCFLGMYLILRFGEAWYLVRWKRKKGHLGRLLSYHPFFHKSRTTVWYLFGMCVMQVCILSVFSVQMFSPELVTDMEGLFPYDLVCLMNVEEEEDMALAEMISTMQDTETAMYPMFRVSGTDATEQAENPAQGRIIGQQIGIAESTYHALKRAVDTEYEEKELGLDDRGERIYIVHQQDKSTKGQPIDFKTSRKTPYLYTGPACPSMDEFAHNTAFSRRTVAGEEVSSLTGIFCQGERENLVVFSDRYFEKAKDMWKTTNKYNGVVMEGDELKEAEQMGEIRQGPSALFLVRADEDTLEGLKPALDAFKERHAADEEYDGRVKSYYLKTKGVDTVRAELLMRRRMGQLTGVTFFAACILLILVKMLTEHSATAKKLEFLTCMGMKKRDRRNLLRFEMRVYYIVVVLLSLAVGSGLTAAAFAARMYTGADIKMMLKRMIPFAAAETVLFGAAVLILTEIYIRRAEKQ